uniref:Uncharacterized protein TCIL3000_10_8430 n=1 Tax=Trypanosoma congolense (strain IL3000) TaxID=1068625 RepID=G0UXF0_TRYCI|nr:unnamed protein product [Trypanosoma congolense IL3000]
MRILISTDTVLPVKYVDNLSEARSKYKPCDIVAGDDQLGSSVVPMSSRGEGHGLSTAREKQKRSRSPPPTESNALTPELQLRQRWVRGVFEGDVPYSLLRRRDLFELCTYIMSSEDYEWCRQNNVPHTFFADAITQLERKYAKCLLKVAGRDTLTGESVNGGDDMPTSKGQGTPNRELGRCPLMEDACGVCGQKAHSDSGNDTFLRCQRCATQAHFRCWYLKELPQDAQRWLCPACSIAKREKGVGHCCACERRGGVMLPYLSAVEWRRYERKADVSAAVSLFCHVVCALAFDELTIDERHGIVHPTKRAKRVGKIALCAFCSSNSGEGLIRCGEAHCFTYMHPACAQAAGTAVCYVSKDKEPGSLWDGCNIYCRDHFRGAVATTADCEHTAEATEALAMDGVTLDNLTNFNRSRSATLDSSIMRNPSRTLLEEYLRSVKHYWVEKRLERQRESATMVDEIRQGKRDILSVVLRPEVLKVSPTEVQLSRFIFLMPELQQHISAVVEGILPLPDDEYDDVQEYRKVHSRTRHTGNTVQLYDKMERIVTHVALVREMSSLIHERTVKQRQWIDAELKILDKYCGITDPS